MGEGTPLPSKVITNNLQEGSNGANTYDNRNNHLDSAVLSQQEGLSALNRFLQRKAGFDSLGIFVIDLNGEKYKKKSGNCQFYLGRLEESSKNPYYLSINPAYYLGHMPELLFVVPRIAHVGKKPYYWVEFTDELIDGIIKPAFTSCRLRPDQSTSKIDSVYWRGFEEQLLVDFIRGENNITTSDLRPFRIKLHSKDPYSFGGIQDLKLCLTANSKINGGDELLIVPRTDSQNLYSWIDIYKQTKTGEELIKISTHRISQEEKKLISIGWKNPETQYLVDYLSGDPKVTFNNLRPLRLKLPEHLGQTYVGLEANNKKKFLISIHKFEVDEVILIPKQDPKGLYQWVEAYEFDPETGEPIGEAITSVRMTRGVGFEKLGWLGAGIQSLIDYSSEVRMFNDLLPITLKVGANTKMLDVWGTKNEHVWLTLSVKSGLKSGDSIELIPDKELEDTIVYKMVRGQTELGSYSFDRKTKKFSVIEFHDFRNIILQPRDYLLDYSQGKIGFTELKTIHLTVKKDPGMIDILSKGKVRIYITPSKSFGLVPEDEVELIPQEENEGQAIFAFVKNGVVLGRYIYESQTMKFYQEPIRDVQALPLISREEALRVLGMFFDN
ncbi:MAG: hypothetical protein HYW86_01945 [Candidatus Roizmanbacteria bacterium]|nr:MAG: hypothetical protein HYW86_01945 [Candidatus Roizmanbacteria bacterium]